MGLSIAFAARALIELAVAALAAKDGILSGGKSDPYLKFFASRFRKDGSRVSKDGAIREMHMTETIPNDLNLAADFQKCQNESTKCQQSIQL